MAFDMGLSILISYNKNLSFMYPGFKEASDKTILKKYLQVIMHSQFAFSLDAHAVCTLQSSFQNGTTVLQAAECSQRIMVVAYLLRHETIHLNILSETKDFTFFLVVT